MANYTVRLDNVTGPDVVSLGDGTTYATLSVNTNVSTPLLSDTNPTLSAGLNLNGNDITGTGDISITGSVTATSADINGGTIDGTVIGGTTPAAISGTTLTATGGNVDLDTLDLNAIAATKGVTAVDVFVYDTSKDSDGGAWRKRTQGTSWYNETLNTATRGSRKGFPAVAVIVAEANKVTIYDGDDPALPMWMVLNTAISHGILVGTNGAITAVSAANNNIAVSVTGPTSNQTVNGCYVIDFLLDGAIKYRAGASYKYGSSLVNRNNSAIQSYLSQPLGAGIISNFMNDVAMTVLPDAPIDPATGLPVPTIAVGTAAGTSVINDDGTVTDAVNVGTYNFVAFTDQGLFVGDDTILEFATYADIKSGDGWGDIVANTTGTADWTLPARIRTDFIAVGNDLAGCGNTAPKSMQLINPDTSDFTKTMTSVVSPTYNTGWMNGDIKGAFLSDTDDTDLVGVEFIDETTDIFGEFFPSAWTYSAVGAASIDGTQTSLERLQIKPNGAFLPVGKYVLSFDVVSGSSVYGVYSNAVGSYISSALSVGHYDIHVDQKSATELKFVFGPADVCAIENVSVKLADADRSVSANGLVVNGTVTRSEVSSGAELVAYSGFSASNYLEQPYNSDLDFGTGDFCVMGWVKWASTGSAGALLHRTSGASIVDASSMVGIISGGTSVAGWVLGTSITFSATKPANVWQFLALARRSGVLYAYLDGVLVATASQAGSLTDTSAISYAGGYWNGSSVVSSGCSSSLLRISATAPTAEQIAKIYNDEKYLFQENAACTLYGTSDAVTALAHDDELGLLHVGTSAGRSVFQGLRRMSNTTTAVGTAISASNGMVVEE